MRILMLVGLFHPNLTEWVEAFHSYGHEVVVIAPKTEKNEDWRRIQPRVVSEQVSRAEAEEIASEINPDLVIIRHKKEGYRRILCAARKKGAVAILYDQDEWLRPLTPRALYRDVERAVKRLVVGYPLRGITPTRGNKGSPRLWMDWIRTPMPTPEGARSRKYWCEYKPTVLMIGKLAHPKKRHLWVLQALKDIGKPFRLLVAGAGDDSDMFPDKSSREYYEEVCETLRRAGEEGGIELYENYSHERMGELYSQADIFVLPSTNEQLGISPVEAMAHGCAVICSDNIGAAGYIEHGVNGLLFGVNSYDDFKNFLAGLLSNKERVEDLGQAAVETMEQHHRPEQFVEQVVKTASINRC